jgi:rhodanese-related sulfurtransferase
MDLVNIIKEKEAQLIDVREPFEFGSGTVQGAINIPLSSIAQEIHTLKKMAGPKVLFCRSGARSHQAAMFLEQNGLQEVYNGGGLFDMEILMYNLK